MLVFCLFMWLRRHTNRHLGEVKAYLKKKKMSQFFLYLVVYSFIHFIDVCVYCLCWFSFVYVIKTSHTSGRNAGVLKKWTKLFIFGCLLFISFYWRVCILFLFVCLFVCLFVYVIETSHHNRQRSGRSEDVLKKMNQTFHINTHCRYKYLKYVDRSDDLTKTYITNMIKGSR